MSTRAINRATGIVYAMTDEQLYEALTKLPEDVRGDDKDWGVENT